MQLQNQKSKAKANKVALLKEAKAELLQLLSKQPKWQQKIANLNTASEFVKCLLELEVSLLSLHHFHLRSQLYSPPNPHTPPQHTFSLILI